MKNNAESSAQFEKKFSILKPLILNSKKMTLFTGAGVSTLSGIPDFRSSQGIYSKKWQNLDVEHILSLSFFLQNPEVFYAWAKEFWYHLDDYQPNMVHRTLAKLEAKGYVKALYTQNIDMLHQKAGSKKLYEVHGGALHHHCTNCNAYYPYSQIAPIVLRDEVPRCKACGSLIKPDIIFYGENLDPLVLSRAYEDFSHTDLCLVLGSSLRVQPAASFPLYATSNGAPLVIVNAQQTTQDGAATLRFLDLEKLFTALEGWVDSLEPRKTVI
ncbi:NAD-dependent protein deacylase [Sphaerochaeta sp. PS]|uniref:NAD-dependent protein deacylase n=1 Tax=Sphaerochaeta sp. PS TaxID=3076336 RepID=UPI0028A43F57|nr:NAD-dependent protein deacylase [Sphaerochaeta sp. PS]MDT4761509.1 NAD-dependent protein deacylase [Sphaerochaeta sp. PS]